MEGQENMVHGDFLEVCQVFTYTAITDTEIQTMILDSTLELTNKVNEKGSRSPKFGAEIRPHSQCQKECFFSQFQMKNSQSDQVSNFRDSVRFYPIWVFRLRVLGNKSKYNFWSTRILFRPWLIRMFLIYILIVFSAKYRNIRAVLTMNQNEPTTSAVTITCCLSTEHDEAHFHFGFFEFFAE